MIGVKKLPHLSKSAIQGILSRTKVPDFGLRDVNELAIAERAKFNSPVRRTNQPIREFILALLRQAARWR